ncbi:MAG TPA: class I SAM-dependent methyltransferase [Ktedonobacteraceae bacterium]
MGNNTARAHKEQIAALYNQVAPNYGRIGPDLFAPFGQWLVNCMNLASGAQVLDVATGRGAVLFAAAEKVGPDGKVMGIDLAEHMVRLTTADIARRQVKNATVQQMDSEHLLFPDNSFDDVLCGYALFFFPDIEQALDEFYRVLRPEGKLGVSVPYGGDERWRWYGELLAAYHEQYHFSLDQGGPFLDPATIISLLSQAEFVEVEMRTQEFEFLYTNEQDWWLSRWAEAARFPLERIPPEALESFRAEVFKRMEPLKEPDGFHYRRNACCFLGKKPVNG